MRTWLRSLVNAILGKVPGKTSRPDTATRMAMDADLSDRQEVECPMGCAAGASETTDTSSSRLARRRTLTQSRS